QVPPGLKTGSARPPTEVEKLRNEVSENSSGSVQGVFPGAFRQLKSGNSRTRYQRTRQGRASGLRASETGKAGTRYQRTRSTKPVRDKRVRGKWSPMRRLPGCLSPVFQATEHPRLS